jgi:hypothetical protein
MASAVISGWPELPDSPLHSREPEAVGRAAGVAAALVAGAVSLGRGATSGERSPAVWAQAGAVTTRRKGAAAAATRNKTLRVTRFIRAAMRPSAQNLGSSPEVFRR